MKFGLFGGDMTIHRQDFAVADQQPIAGTDGGDVDFMQPGAVIAHGGAGDATEQGGHFLAGAASSKGFEQLAARIHQRNHIAGQRLAKGQGRRHGQGRHDIEADIAAAQRDDDLPEQTCQNRGCAQGPCKVGIGAKAGKPERGADAQSRQRDGEQNGVIMLAEQMCQTRNGSISCGADGRCRSRLAWW